MGRMEEKIRRFLCALGIHAWKVVNSRTEFWGDAVSKSRGVDLIENLECAFCSAEKQRRRRHPNETALEEEAYNELMGRVRRV